MRMSHFYMRLENIRSKREHGITLTGLTLAPILTLVMLMGIHSQRRLEDYWNTSEDKPTFPLQTEMSRERLQQTSCYFKINSLHEVLDDN
jgi:hypothetical protein